MFGNGKVVWKEGMFLQPQHFQQSDRFLLNLINQRLSAYQPFHYGVLDLVIDKEGLSNSLLLLSRCRAILPDGTYLDIPREDAAPAARSFADHFTHDLQLLDVYLALPLAVEGMANTASAQVSGAAARYRGRTVQVADEVLGTSRKEIEVGAASFTILFGQESLDNYASIRIARLGRNQMGQAILQEAFIPPLLSIGASPALTGDLRTVLQVLLAKISSLSSGRKQVEGGFAAFAGSEETAFRLLQTLNTYAPQLNHFHQEPACHPYEVYNVLCQLTGALCTFSAEVSVTQIPRYDHNNLTATFGTLVKIIRSILEADISAGCVNLPLTQINQATYVCSIADQRLLSTAKFFLGVSAKVPEKELIVGALQRIKMCSREKLDILISSAMPGLSLLHVSRPPEGLSTKPSFVYFSVDQQGSFWDAVKTAGSLAFYFPNNFPELKIEVLALKN
jgi:type VI secretion system protein ImpJ